ncbi:addiction module antidote protein [Bradyrhizobium sp. 31Argb]|uniref:addiction module antidote protein n=1 Tax=Bradyrhizobium sp. 31Argb TaxID=3141247 RepID=UPI003747AEDD
MSPKSNATKTPPRARFSAADLKIQPFDLTSPERIEGYLKEATATGDPAVVQHALGAIARARGMTKVARASGVSRESLYRLLSAQRAANFRTVVFVADALGFELAFKPKKSGSRAARPAGFAGGGKPRKVGKASRQKKRAGA